MKNSSYLYAVGLAAIISCSAPKSENVEASASAEVSSEVKSDSIYGEAFKATDVLNMSELESALGGQDSVFMKLTGTVNSTCAVKGCWMKMDLPGDDELRVSFKDYSFFVPKSGVEGKTAVVNGYVKKVVTDVETLKHFAEDAGKSQEEIDAIDEPKEEYSFVASGVIIKESK